MNIHEKLQTIRVELQKLDIIKTGKNKFVGYSYFELRDFLPIINELMLKNKLTSAITYSQDMAILRIVNIEKPDEFIDFTCPMSEAQLKGAHAVQNLGAVITYIRRYLYINAFEIVENDILDTTQGDNYSREYKTKKEAHQNATPISMEAFDSGKVCKKCGSSELIKKTAGETAKRPGEEYLTCSKCKSFVAYLSDVKVEETEQIFNGDGEEVPFGDEVPFND